MRNAAPALVDRFSAARALLVVLLAGLALAGRAADIYRILGIEVDDEAESAVAARERAIAAGQRDGLVRLMQRLTSPEDHGRLPAVDGHRRSSRSSPATRSRASGSAPTRYLATLNVSYVAGGGAGAAGVGRTVRS